MIRVKEEAKKILRDEIMKQIDSKGEVRKDSAHCELMDLHSNYIEGKQVLTNIGGHFQQLYYVVASVLDLYNDGLAAYHKRMQENPTAEENKKAHHPREMLLEHFFLPFLAQYLLKDPKFEGMSFVCSEEMHREMQELKVPMHSSGHFDLSKMKQDQYIKFRYLFVEKRMNNELFVANRNEQAMDLLLNALCLIMCKKVPAEIGVNKVESLALKIKLLPRTDKMNDSRPTQAVLRLMPVIRPGSVRETDKEANETQDSRFADEIDQEGKAVAMNGRLKNYIVPVINHIAARHVRDDFCKFMAKQIPEFFKTDDGPKELKKILAHADRRNTETEDKFVADHCTEYEVPCFEMPTNARDYE